MVNTYLKSKGQDEGKVAVIEVRLCAVKYRGGRYLIKDVKSSASAVPQKDWYCTATLHKEPVKQGAGDWVST